jgi:hypothetical protein
MFHLFIIIITIIINIIIIISDKPSSYGTTVVLQ